MAYVPGFKWDIFISYPMEAEAWTKRFEADLRDGGSLAAIKDKDLKIFFAPRNFNDHSQEMLEAAQNSALLVSILTRDALTANVKRFLQLEMDAFRASGPLRGRFCPIPLYPIPESELSKAMPVANTAGGFWSLKFKFYHHYNGTPLWLEKDIEPGLYFTTVRLVAEHLRDLLDALVQERPALPPPPPPPEPVYPDVTVLLAADKSNFTEAETQQIRNLLLSYGAQVVPVSTSHNGSQEPDAHFEEAVRKSDVFVQLFSALDKLERCKALQKFVQDNNPSISTLQWRKRLSDPKEDVALIENLADEARDFCEGAHVQTGLLEVFKRAVIDELERQSELKKKIIDGLERQSKPKDGNGRTNKPYLYIIADTSDRLLARKLQDAARQSTDVFIMAGDEAQRRVDFEQSLVVASGVVFLHGKAAREFVDGWLAEYFRKTRLLQVHPKIAALYQAPPEKSEEDEPQKPSTDLRIEGSQKEFTLQGIERICAELCSAHG